MPVDYVEKNIDKGMWDILIVLNQKNYITEYCCEGHLHDERNKGKNYWLAYLAFVDKHTFKEYPPMFCRVTRNRRYFYWEGNGEESRQKFLTDVLDWANTLPTKPKKKVTIYHLIADYKNQSSRTGKVLCYSEDYEDIRCTLKRNDIGKYCNLKVVENVKYV